MYTIGCLPSLTCRHCVEPANSVPGGEASLVIGSRKNISEAERNVLLSSRPFCKANSNRRQNGLGVPSLYGIHLRDCACVQVSIPNAEPNCVILCYPLPWRWFHHNPKVSNSGLYDQTVSRRLNIEPTLKKFLMAAMWLEHSVLRYSSTFCPTYRHTQSPIRPLHTYSIASFSAVS